METLAKYTTLGIGGPCAHIAVAGDSEALCAALRNAPDALILGGGSNVVIADEGFSGTIIRLTNKTIVVRDEGSHVRVIADAGVVWDFLVAQTCQAGLAELACLSGIPGSVGAAPVQNIGAYGSELAQTLDCVHAISRETLQPVRLSREACDFHYRHSIFKGKARDRFVITGIELCLSKKEQPHIEHGELAQELALIKEKPDAMRIRETVIAIRRRKSMVLDANDVNSRSVGSFFMNPIVDKATADHVEEIMQPMGERCPRFVQDDGRVKLSAARLLEASGIIRGLQEGGARISQHHVLAITNMGNATARDVVALAQRMRNAVRDTLGVVLVPEPVFVGFPEAMPLC